MIDKNTKLFSEVWSVPRDFFLYALCPHSGKVRRRRLLC